MPLQTWSIIRAAKAAEPTLRLNHASVAGSINWERAPKLAFNGEMRMNEEHPLHPRPTWAHQAGPAHISEYWPWVEHRVREAYVRSRYSAFSHAGHLRGFGLGRLSTCGWKRYL